MTPEEMTELMEEASETPPEAETSVPAEPPETPDKSQKRKQILERCRKGGSILLLVFAVLLVGYYTLFPSRGYFHSDTTDTIMWAQASYESGKVFDPDFGYACLLPFGTNLIMQALMPFTGVTMTTHVLGMLCFFLLFAGSLILMLRQMDWKIGWISLTVFSVLMICSGSMKLREIFWGHTIYYSLGVFFIFAGLSMVFRQMNLSERAENLTEPEQKKKNQMHLIICMAVIFIWFLLTGSDQITSITIFTLPVMGAVFCERWFDRNAKILSVRNLHTVIMLVLMLVGTAIGFAITKHNAGSISAGYAEAYSQYSAMDKWQENLQKFPLAWLSLLGVEVKANDPLMAAASIKSLLIIIISILILILPIAALFCWNQIQDRKLKILLLTYWFMTLLIMMGYVLGKLSAANWRLSPIVAMSAVVSAAFLRWTFSQINWQRLSVLLTACIMLTSCIHASVIMAMPKDNVTKNRLYDITQELERRNLSYGYATFWNANAVTILADSKVKCRSVEINDSGFWIKKYQCNSNWYEDQPEQNSYFVLLNNSEAQQLRDINYELLERPHAEFSYGIFEVWVFEENIF